MTQVHGKEVVVKVGTYLYDGSVECDIRIVRSPTRYGSGDYEDLPEVENDMKVDTFYVQYGSTTERDRFNAGGGGYSSLADAIAGAEAAPGIGKSIVWKG
jgi:hypothetical protein